VWNEDAELSLRLKLRMAIEPQLIDQRGTAKVPTFSGRRTEFEGWILLFESYCGLLGWERFLDSAKASSEEIEVLSLSDEAERVGRSLYHLLVSTTKGTALSIVRLTERGNGFEAFQRLMVEFRPRLSEEHGTMLQMILTPRWWKDRESKQTFTEILICWDMMIARYEQSSGEKVTNNMKTSTIMDHAPEEVNNLRRSVPADARSDYGRMRTTIFEAIIGRQRGSCALPPMNEGPRPMEVDAITGGKAARARRAPATPAASVARRATPRRTAGSSSQGKGKGSSKGGRAAARIPARRDSRASATTARKLATSRANAGRRRPTTSRRADGTRTPSLRTAPQPARRAWRPSSATTPRMATATSSACAWARRSAP
jgi:hypothetical protein